jgi:hypothetical protein
VAQSPQPSNNLLKNELRWNVSLPSMEVWESNYISPSFLYFWIYFTRINSILFCHSWSTETGLQIIKIWI